MQVCYTPELINSQRIPVFPYGKITHKKMMKNLTPLERTKTQYSGLLKGKSPEGKPLAIRQNAALESQQMNNNLAKANNREKQTSKSNKNKTDFLMRSTLQICHPNIDFSKNYLVHKDYLMSLSD